MLVPNSNQASLRRTHTQIKHGEVQVLTDIGAECLAAWLLAVARDCDHDDFVNLAVMQDKSLWTSAAIKGLL